MSAVSPRRAISVELAPLEGRGRFAQGSHVTLRSWATTMGRDGQPESPWHTDAALVVLARSGDRASFAVRRFYTSEVPSLATARIAV